ncbi:MAG TPA: proton-conducting transporter membrane subunit [bacterium]|nr:proton-conducting transporter membrane subunit [bacterium]
MRPDLLFLLPFAAVFPVWVLAWFDARLSRALALAVAVAGVLAALGGFFAKFSPGLMAAPMGGWAAPWGIEIRIVPFTIFWTALLYLLAFLGLWVGVGREKSAGLGPDAAPAAILLFTGSLAALGMDRDLFDLYLFVELALLAGGILIARGGRDLYWPAFRFTLAGSLGASFLLLGFLYLYAGTGTLNLDDLLSQLLIDKNEDLIGFGGAWLTLGLALALLFPAPGLFSAFLARLSPELTAFLAPLVGRSAALLLFSLYFCALGAPGFQTPLGLAAAEQAAVVFFLAGFWAGSGEKTWGKVTAFLSVAVLGYVVAGFVLGSTTALQGALLELVSQSLALAGFFYLSIWLRDAVGTDELARLAGLGRRAPGAAALFILLGLNLAGLPPTGGFYGKYYLFEAALQQRQWFLALALLAAYGFTLVYFARGAWRLFVRPEENPLPLLHPKKTPASLNAALWILALAGLALGLAHKTFLKDLITPALPKAFQHWTPPVETWGTKDVE